MLDVLKVLKFDARLTSIILKPAVSTAGLPIPPDSHLSSLQKSRIKRVDVMFCKDDRCESGVYLVPRLKSRVSR